VVACDPSVPFIESAQQRLPDSRVTFVVAEAGSLPRRKGGYDAIVSGLALNFFPDPGLAMEEQLSTVCPGGLVGAFVWDYAYGMEFLRHFWDAAAAIEPKAADMDEARRFPICNPDSLKSLFEAPFLGGTGPAPRLVSTLSSEQREALIDDLKSRLPIQSGGSIELWARAWAVVGHRGQR
jgi:SAM-dependent methyltransferase